MGADQRIRGPARGLSSAESGRAVPAIAPDALVVLRRPRALRGVTAVVRREVPGGWEVEVRSPSGTPMHLVVPANAMLLA